MTLTVAKRRILAGVVAAGIAAAGFVGGHAADESTVTTQVGCGQESPTCIIDDQVAPSAENALTQKAQTGALDPPSQFTPATPQKAGVTGGGNGNLTLTELAPATGGVPNAAYPGTGQLANAPSAAWNAMAVHIHAVTGVWIGSNGSDSMYRPLPRQIYWRNYWCSQGACQNAAVPGTSNHGWGYAVDVPATTRSLIVQYGAPYGWRFACSDAPWESWHIKWCGGWSGTDPGPYGQGGGSTGPVFKTLKVGSKGKRVKTLSTHLALLHRTHTHGTYIKWKNRTRRFGGGLEIGVEKFQRDEKLHADGKYGLHSHHHMKRRWNHYKDTHHHSKTVLNKTSSAAAVSPVSRNDWAHADLNALSAPHTTRNARALVSWMQAEGGNALWNPLNTTMWAPGSWNYNSVGVKNYPDFQTGLSATVKTIEQTNPAFGYALIVRRLRNSARPASTLRAVEDSAWGTGGLALRVLPEVQQDYWRFARILVAGS